MEADQRSWIRILTTVNMSFGQAERMTKYEGKALASVTKEYCKKILERKPISDQTAVDAKFTMGRGWALLELTDALRNGNSHLSQVSAVFGRIVIANYVNHSVSSPIHCLI